MEGNINHYKKKTSCTLPAQKKWAKTQNKNPTKIKHIVLQNIIKTLINVQQGTNSSKSNGTPSPQASTYC